MASAPGPSSREHVTQLLIDWGNGDKEALDRLTPIVYSELHKLAESYLRRERDAATLQPTALVHEAYIRVVAQNLPDWQSRAHFFGVAAQLMRQILVDNARRHRSEKRGGGAVKFPLTEALSFTPERSSDVIALRFFGGLSVEETAQALGVSVATVGREQRLAEAWLHREMSRTPES